MPPGQRLAHGQRSAPLSCFDFLESNRKGFSTSTASPNSSTCSPTGPSHPKRPEERGKLAPTVRDSAWPWVTQTAGDRGGWDLSPGSPGSLSPPGSGRQCPGRAAGARVSAWQLLLTCDNGCLFSWGHSSKGLMFNSLQSLGLHWDLSGQTSQAGAPQPIRPGR